MSSQPVTQEETTLVPLPSRALVVPKTGVLVPSRKKDEPPPDYPHYKWEPGYKAYDGTFGAYRFRMKPRHEKGIDINTARKTIGEARLVGQKRARTAANRAEGIEQPATSSQTFAAWWKTYRAATVEGYVDPEKADRAVLPFLKKYGSVKLCDFDQTEHCQTYITALKKRTKANGHPYADSTLAVDLALIAAVFEAAVPKYLAYNPWKKTSRPKGTPRSNTLSRKDQPGFLAALPSDEDRRLILTILGTGLRAREIIGASRPKAVVGLRPCDVTGLLLTVRKETAKRRKARTVPIQAATFAILETQRISRGLTLTDTRPYFDVGHSTIHWRLDHAQEALGLVEKVTLHDLRRTYGTRCAIDSKLDPKSLMRLMGHTDIKMTMTYYVQVDEAQLRSAVTTLDLGL